jgi:hypothetical protein
MLNVERSAVYTRTPAAPISGVAAKTSAFDHLPGPPALDYSLVSFIFHTVSKNVTSTWESPPK